MKLLLLSDANSAHTIKWAKAIKLNNIEVCIFSLFEPTKYTSIEYEKNDIKLVYSNKKYNFKNREPSFQKLAYFKSLPLLRKTIKSFKPDILHSHYASSYGALGFLSRFQPFVLSVWGTDIYYFPKKSILNKLLLKRILSHAEIICSTSKAMKNMIFSKYSKNRRIIISGYKIS